MTQAGAPWTGGEDENDEKSESMTRPGTPSTEEEEEEEVCAHSAMPTKLGGCRRRVAVWVGGLFGA
jgi:hypothetical protein